MEVPVAARTKPLPTQWLKRTHFLISQICCGLMWASQAKIKVGLVPIWRLSGGLTSSAFQLLKANHRLLAYGSLVHLQSATTHICDLPPASRSLTHSYRHLLLLRTQWRWHWVHQPIQDTPTVSQLTGNLNSPLLCDLTRVTLSGDQDVEIFAAHHSASHTLLTQNSFSPQQPEWSLCKTLLQG